MRNCLFCIGVPVHDVLAHLGDRIGADRGCMIFPCVADEGDDVGDLAIVELGGKRGIANAVGFSKSRAVDRRSR
jgi:hypothetical protein